MTRSEPEYVLVAAVPAAACPRCGKLVTVESAFVATVRGACRHYSHAELVEGQAFIAFRKTKRKTEAIS